MGTQTAEETPRTEVAQEFLVTSSLRRLLIMSVLGILFVVTGHEPFGTAATHVAAVGLAISMVLRPARAERVQARAERTRWRVLVPRWICSGREHQTQAPLLRYRIDRRRPG
ncbi:hypothetical protein [Allokutzneria albata]|uniref:Uncharacterized protein n=1 Tax=Allokutzneria albata TaxID=211114 RepID=A0A1G9VZ53_ALLAB|nr:hypothetical protein [Allokutzneria albata]SDM77569.1 hypothetical protein SAMN04489726_3315 [Allokutzneria albata]